MGLAVKEGMRGMESRGERMMGGGGDAWKEKREHGLEKGCEDDRRERWR